MFLIFILALNYQLEKKLEIILIPSEIVCYFVNITWNIPIKLKTSSERIWL